MAYKFGDRLKEWTSYVGVAAVGLGMAIPAFVPVVNNHWAEFWQAAQMGLGFALALIPQTAGTTAVENDAWSLLRAFAKAAPPQYSDAIQPLLAELASHLAKAETATVAVPAPKPTPVEKAAKVEPKVVYAIQIPDPQTPGADPAAARAQPSA